MFVVIVVLAALGVSLVRLTQWLERQLATWKETERAIG
jgi:ABC-type nitrate/sulfonate/bicarbonate transport system permease component